MKIIALDHYDMVRNGELDLLKIGELAAKYGESTMTRKELDRLDDRDFGLILVASDGSRFREFPLRNKFEVIMSKSAAVMHSKQIPAKARNILDTRISAAARRFLPGMHKTASATDLISNVYTLTPRDERKLASSEIEKTASYFAINSSLNGGDMHRYAIDTPEQVRRGINRFETKHRGMNIKYAFAYARNIGERAGVLGIDVPEDSAVNLYKTASMSPYARRHISSRLKYAPDEAHPAYLGLMLKTASISPEQLAVALDTTDRQYAMDTFYDTHFPDAGSSVLDFRKRADVINLSGTDIDKDEFLDTLASNEESFSDLLGEDAIKELKKDPEAVLTSLPMPHKQKILEMLTDRSS